MKHGLERAPSNQGLVLSCPGALHVGNLTRTQINPPACRWALHETRGDKAETDIEKQMPMRTARRAAGEHQLCRLGFHQSLSGKENVPVLPRGPQRFICKCHTCQILSNCVSSGWNGTEKSSGGKLRTNRLILIYLFIYLFGSWSGRK